MAQEKPPVDEMHYEQLAQDALRGVIRLALERAAEPEGIPGAHHFYITFKTGAPGVSIPTHLKERFPDEMTIVLQNKFWDLNVDEDSFSVGLSFNQIPAKLMIPFAAITAFVDPSVDFGLQFQVSEEDLADPDQNDEADNDLTPHAHYRVLPLPRRVALVRILAHALPEPPPQRYCHVVNTVPTF